MTMMMMMMIWRCQRCRRCWRYCYRQPVTDDTRSRLATDDPQRSSIICPTLAINHSATVGRWYPGRVHELEDYQNNTATRGRRRRRTWKDAGGYERH